MKFSSVIRILLIFILLSTAVTACAPPEFSSGEEPFPSVAEESLGQVEPTPGIPLPTPLPTREPYPPGTLVDYEAQTGDTLDTLAIRFNTTVAEIRQVNPNIPNETTTMPPGMPMKIPIYYEPLWGSPYRIIPDWLFINGPSQIDFDAVAFVNSQPGWLKDYKGFLGGDTRRGGEIVNYVADLFSLSPQLLLALIEYQAGGLSQAEPTVEITAFPLGYRHNSHRGFINQLLWAANTLNNGFYSYRLGVLNIIDRPDGRQEPPDPWQNAATVALQSYFSKVADNGDEYVIATSGEGLAKTFTQLFGDPWVEFEPHIPGSLHQPDLRLPFQVGLIWAYTGGPHTGWGEGAPYSAIDFAPPNVAGGCSPTTEMATALADGVIARTGPAYLFLDLDGDGDVRTGWVIFYLHLANGSFPSTGTRITAGDPIGLPSCEGGKATGTHVHIARLYNGEWMPAGSGTLPFNLEGWVVQDGSQPYQGYLLRFDQRVRASTGSDNLSHISSNYQP